MAEIKEYKTKQRALIEQALINTKSHITVDSLCEKIAQIGHNVGRTTVYRTLEKLVSEGKAHKYEMGAGQSACYQYIGENKVCNEHFHLKCTDCGNLIHMECKSIEKLCSHIEGEHSFRVDKSKTVLYGVCEQCAGK